MTLISADAPGPEETPLQRLLYRWFVQYNPLYLLSAALVLTGTWLCARGLAHEQGSLVHLGVASTAEVYAACLIAGAAVLTRAGHRRPAVMLALLSLLYQWDLTLHTERAPYLEEAWTAAAWALVFAAKLPALAWAVRIRLSRAALGTLLLGGLGVAFFPAALPVLGPRAGGALVMGWVFALVSAQPSARVESLVPLDAWGATVLRRAVRAAWIASTVLVGLHVAFWWSEGVFPLAALLPVAPLLLVRHLRSEGRVWAVAAVAPIAVGLTTPVLFSATALLAAVALVLRVVAPLVPPERRWSPAAPAAEPPYRGVAADVPPEGQVIEVEAPPLDAAARARIFAGAAFAAYLAVWTIGWTSGPWPAHMAALDVAAAALALLVALRPRARVILVPALGSGLHFVVQAGLLPAPRSLVEWGASAVALGFVLLLGSVATTLRIRPAPP